jgi:hypothetical protein
MVKTYGSLLTVVRGLVAFFATAYRAEQRNFAHSTLWETRNVKARRCHLAVRFIKEVLGGFVDMGVVVGVLDGVMVE